MPRWLVSHQQGCSSTEDLPTCVTQGHRTVFPHREDVVPQVGKPQRVQVLQYSSTNMAAPIKRSSTHKMFLRGNIRHVEDEIQ